MKKAIHPKIYTNTVVTCACGNKFTTVSTLEAISVDICSNCHPFFTGQQKFIDTEGRIEKFNKKRLRSEDKVKQHLDLKKTKEEKKVITADAKANPTLKELMKQVQSTETKTETKDTDTTEQKEN